MWYNEYERKRYFLQGKREMQYCFGALGKLLFGILSIALQIANALVGNILVFESTENVRFNWFALLKNPLFWILLTITLIYYLFSLIVHQASVTDEALDEAYSKHSIELLDDISNYAKEGKFTSCKKTFKVFDQIQKRRAKGCRQKSKSKKARRKK